MVKSWKAAHAHIDFASAGLARGWVRKQQEVASYVLTLAAALEWVNEAQGLEARECVNIHIGAADEAKEWDFFAWQGCELLRLLPFPWKKLNIVLFGNQHFGGLEIEMHGWGREPHFHFSMVNAAMWQNRLEEGKLDPLPDLLLFLNADPYVRSEPVYMHLEGIRDQAAKQTGPAGGKRSKGNPTPTTAVVCTFALANGLANSVEYAETQLKKDFGLKVRFEGKAPFPSPNYSLPLGNVMFTDPFNSNTYWMGMTW